MVLLPEGEVESVSHSSRNERRVVCQFARPADGDVMLDSADEGESEEGKGSNCSEHIEVYATERLKGLESWN
jgi:hypothetical protein